MAVDLENRPPDADSDANNPGQTHYNNEFNNLMSREFPQGQGGKSGEHSFGNPNNPDNESTGGLNPHALAGAETLGGKAGEAVAAAGAARAALQSGGNIPLAAVRFALSHKKQTAGGAGIIGGIVMFLIVIFFMLIPLKIENIVTNLQDHFYSGAENAISNESESLLSGYVRSSILPALTKCPGSRTSSIDKSCNPSLGASRNPVMALYKGWQQGRLETTLAKDYGIEFRSVGSRTTGIKYYLKAPGVSDTELSHAAIAGSGDIFNEPGFKSATRAELRQAIKDQTKWYQVFTRYKVGRLLEEKYGIKRCITPVGCKVSDKVVGSVAKQKTAAATYIYERVFQPRTEILGTVFQCLFLTPCDTKPNVQPCTEGVDCSDGGEPASDTDREVTSTLDKAVAKYFGEDAYKIYGDINESGGITAYLAKVLVTNVFNSASAGEIAGSTIPYVGWINLAVQLYNQASHLGPTVKHMRYIINAASMVQLWSVYRTYSDEIHSGNVSATEVGSFTNSLGSVANSDKGGSGSAEQTPLYQSIIEGQTPTAKPVQTSGLIGTALAASTTSTTSPSVTCDNGKPIAGMVCPEESLSGSSAFADMISNTLNSPFLIGAKASAAIWNGTISQIYGLVGDVIGPVAGFIFKGADFVLSNNPITSGAYNAFKSAFSDIAKLAMQFFVGLFIPNPFGTNMGGDRTFDLMAGGADVAGNDTAHHQLGGVQMTAAQTATIRNEQQDEAMQSFKNQPMFARLFSTDTPYSLVSRVAMDIPSGTGSAVQTTFSSIISNPLQLITHSLSSLFTVNGKAFAAVSATPDAFGVSQYGFPNFASSQAATDPQAYWDANCSDNPSNNYQKTNTYNETAVSHVNPDTGMPENPADPSSPDGGADYCALINASVGSVGAVYDQSLLTQDDLADLNGGGGSSAPTTGVSGDAKTLAQQILASPNVSFAFPDAKTDMEDAAAGKPGTAGAMTSALLLQLPATLVSQGHKISISAIQSSGTGHCIDANGHPRGPNSPYGPCPFTDYHYVGDAIDINQLDGQQITGRNAPAITVIKTAEGIWPSGSEFGQSECGAAAPLPSGWTTFTDTCTHIHLQVPQGSQ